MSAYKFGDIVLVGLGDEPDPDNHLMARPALIVSADAINEHLQTLIVCPLIEAKQVTQSRTGATFIPREVAGLKEHNLVLSLHIKTIPEKRILKRISSLPSSYLLQVKESIQAVLDLE
ncbi:MAG: type II toxin-antitoxin system PemK/MazF family toxin [bacterium]